MKEFDFIKRYLQTGTDKDVVLGIGDDAAIVRPREGFDLCFSADMLLKDRHFLQMSNLKAWLEGFTVNISDMAAMGAIPRWVLLSAALPELDEVWLERFCGSFFGLAKSLA